MKAVLCPVCNGCGWLSSGACSCHGCGGLGWVTVPEDRGVQVPITPYFNPSGTSGDYWKVNWCHSSTILQIVAELDKLRE